MLNDLIPPVDIQFLTVFYIEFFPKNLYFLFSLTLAFKKKYDIESNSNIQINMNTLVKDVLQ